MNLRSSSADWVPSFETRMRIRSNRKALLSLRKLRGASSLLPPCSIVRSTLHIATASFCPNELNSSLSFLARSAAALIAATGLRSSIWIRSILVLILSPNPKRSQLTVGTSHHFGGRQSFQVVLHQLFNSST